MGSTLWLFRAGFDLSHSDFHLAVSSGPHFDSSTYSRLRVCTCNDSVRNRCCCVRGASAVSSSGRCGLGLCGFEYCDMRYD